MPFFQKTLEGREREKWLQSEPLFLLWKSQEMKEGDRNAKCRAKADRKVCFGLQGRSGVILIVEGKGRPIGVMDPRGAGAALGSF
jgi:hypothetical protein